MYPILLQIGNFKIHTYGILVAFAFLVGIFLAAKEAKRTGEDPEKILDITFYLILGAIIGSRILYIILHYPYFLENPLEMIKIWKGGLVFYGGFLLALSVVIWYIRKNQLNFWKILDILAPSIAIGQGIGRLGCFFAGCCFGKETTLPWAVTFSHHESLARLGVPLHPVQLYASINAFSIFIILTIAKRYKKFDGFILWLYVLLYATTRTILEIFRGDERGLIFYHSITSSQFIAIILGMISVFMLFYLGTKHQKRH
ncbi:MAG: prolipoprotein diacylglyceryl transferase [Thermodesulfobacteriota bacterium]|nr:prolipoprotein diacylglyceryl transferase [Thermodesulfobacteriota bacterium]